MNKKFLVVLAGLIFIGLTSNLFYSKFMQPDRIKQVEISGIRSEWLEAAYPIALKKNRNDFPNPIRGQRFSLSILAHAQSSIGFRIDKRFKYFRSWIGLDRGVGTRGEVRFLAYLDDQPIFISNAIRGGEAPQPIVLDIRKGELLELVVDPVGDNTYDQAIWGGPEFLNVLPVGSLISSFHLPWQKIKLGNNKYWDSGQKNFPNKYGLLIWQVLAGLFYLSVLGLGFLKRGKITAKFKIPTDLLNRPESYVLFLTGILALWVFIPFMREGLPASWDAGALYYRCLIMKNIFLCNFRLDGWSPYWFLGVQQFLFYPPLPFLLIVLLHFLTFQLVPLVLVFKLIYFIAYFSLPFVCYWLLRQMEIDPLASSLAALGVPAFSAIHGIGIEALFTSGIFTSVFSLPFFCLALGVLIRPVKRPYIAAMVFAFAYLAHIFLWIYLLFCLFLFVPFNFNRKYLQYILSVLLISFLLIAFHFVPFAYFYAQGLSGPETGWGNISFFQEILMGRYFGAAAVNFFALTGFILALLSRKKNLIIIALLVLITYLLSFLSSFGILHYLPNQLLEARIFPYLAIGFVILSGVFYQKVSLLFRGREKEAIALLLFISVAVSTGGKLFFLKELVKVDSDFSGPLRSSYLAAFAWLKQNTPENIIIGFDRKNEITNVGFNQMESQINIHADRYTLGGNQLELTCAINMDLQDHLADRPPEVIWRRCDRYNVSYLIVKNKQADKNLDSRRDLFQPVYRQRPLSVWQVCGHDFRYLENENIKIMDFWFSPEKIKWTLLNLSGNNMVVTAVAYHPNWQLLLDGEKAPIKKTEDHLIGFRLPRPGSLYKVELSWQRSLTERALNFISLLTFLIVTGLILGPLFCAKMRCDG